MASGTNITTINTTTTNHDGYGYDVGKPAPRSEHRAKTRKAEGKAHAHSATVVQSRCNAID